MVEACIFKLYMLIILYHLIRLTKFDLYLALSAIITMLGLILEYFGRYVDTTDAL